jgi:Tfp pilus assembly protein PilF
MRAWIALAALFALAACVQEPTTAQHWRVCESAADASARISACTVVAHDEGADASQRAAALVQRGMLRRDYGEHARAVADFGRALRLDARAADAYVERALVHQERGAFEIAVRDFDAALAIDPNIPLAIERREVALQGREGAYRTALDRLTRALARDPQNAALHNNMCWFRAINDRELDAALADCDAALAIDPAYSAALDSRGLVQLKRGEFAAALADYEAALRIEPGNGHYLHGRGLVRRALGMTVEGDADITAAELAEPGIGEAYSTYGAR